MTTQIERPIFAEDMDLRDYFAAHALTGIIANKSWPGVGDQEAFDDAQEAYQIADAMMEVREE